MKLSEVKTLKSGADVKNCTFSIAGINFLKFFDKDGVTVAVAKDCIYDATFGKNNNFAESDIIDALNSNILPKLENAVGAENIKEFELDLTSLDGLDTYGKIKTRIGIPTFDFYRENVRLFDKYKPDKWWWTATPDTTAEHLNNSWITCVSPVGFISSNFYFSNSGVRPFLIFDASISVSCER